MGTAFGMKIMAKVVIVGGMCGIITSWNSFLIGGSRAMYSMAESYMIPKTFAKLHPKHKTPINALILIGVLTMLAPFAREDSFLYGFLMQVTSHAVLLTVW